MNPEIDVGQVEGAFVMGLGLWLTEKFIYDTKTGQNLTNGTWVIKLDCIKYVNTKVYFKSRDALGTSIGTSFVDQLLWHTDPSLWGAANPKQLNSTWTS